MYCNGTEMRQWNLLGRSGAQLSALELLLALLLLLLLGFLLRLGFLLLLRELGLRWAVRLERLRSRRRRRALLLVLLNRAERLLLSGAELLGGRRRACELRWLALVVRLLLLLQLARGRCRALLEW